MSRTPTRTRSVAAKVTAGAAVVGSLVAIDPSIAGAQVIGALGYDCTLIQFSAHTDAHTPSQGLKRVNEVHEAESWAPAAGLCGAMVCNTAGAGVVIYANGRTGFQHQTSTHTGCGIWRRVNQPWAGAIDPMSATYRLKWRSDGTQQNWWTRDLHGM